MDANWLQVGAASSSDASILLASRRAQSTRNWGRARDGSREGERREAKPCEKTCRLLSNFAVLFAARERERRLGTRQRLGTIRLGGNRFAGNPTEHKNRYLYHWRQNVHFRRWSCEFRSTPSGSLRRRSTSAAEKKNCEGKINLGTIDIAG